MLRPSKRLREQQPIPTKRRRVACTALKTVDTVCVGATRWSRADALMAAVANFVAARQGAPAMTEDFHSALAELLLEYMLVMRPQGQGTVDERTEDKLQEAGLPASAYAAEGYAFEIRKYLAESANGMVFMVDQQGDAEVAAVLKVLLAHKSDRVAQFEMALETFLQTVLYCYLEQRSGGRPVPVPRVIAPLQLAGGMPRYGLVMERMDANLYDMIFRVPENAYFRVHRGVVQVAVMVKNQDNDWLPQFKRVRRARAPAVQSLAQGESVQLVVDGQARDMVVSHMDDAGGVNLVDRTQAAYADADILCVLLQLMYALGELQGLHFQHADLRSDNVMCRMVAAFPVTGVSTTISAKLIDFGNSCIDVCGQKVLPVRVNPQANYQEFAAACARDRDSTDAAFLLGNILGYMNDFPVVKALLPVTWSVLEALFADAVLEVDNTMGEYYDELNSVEELPPFVEHDGDVFTVQVVEAPYSTFPDTADLRFTDQFAYRAAGPDFTPAALVPVLEDALMSAPPGVHTRAAAAVPTVAVPTVRRSRRLRR